MINLILAIISAALIAIFMRLGEGRMKNNMAMFVVNYGICELFALYFIRGKSLFPSESGITLVTALGIISGILYLASFLLLQINIRKNGVVLSTTFMKLGVIIPTCMAVVVFHEQPKFLQVIGILLAIIAIIMIHFEKEESANTKYRFLLLVMILVCGITDSMANIYDKLGNSALKDQYLVYTFAAAMICAIILWVKEKQSFCKWDLLIGICVGIPNYFSARFLILALHEIPAVITYPVCNIATIVIVSLAGVILFKEKLSKRKVIAMAIIFAAIAMLNI